MAIDDLDLFRGQLPAVFEDHTLPPEWADEWFIVPIDDPEAVGEQSDLESGLLLEEFSLQADNVYVAPIPADSFWRLPQGWTAPVPDVAGGSRFPGAPGAGWQEGSGPPPDALAFYLPFHYFHPTWWGIYLTLEGVLILAEAIARHAGGALSSKECVTASRQFLYSHEAFHHHVETFALRLESTHRKPLYARGFESEFQRTYGTDECIEEAVANGHALRRVMSLNAKLAKPKRTALETALKAMILASPPGYRRGLEFKTPAAFAAGRADLAEGYHAASLPSPPVASVLWKAASYMFAGISRVGSRTNYLVRRDSPLAQRLKLQGRYARYRDVTRKLEALAGCRRVRSGKGAHELWERPDGGRFPLSRHSGDIPLGTLRAIIREAGLSMSVSEFLAG